MTEKDVNIRIEPSELSKHKTVELRFDGENSLRSLNEYSIKSGDLGWNKLDHIEFPNGNLEYLDKFELYDNANITMELTNNKKSLNIDSVSHKLPPKPEFRLNWNNDYLTVMVTNYDDKYIMKIIIDGVIQTNNFENVYFIEKEGNHLIYIEYVDDALLTMNYLLETIEYKKKYDVPAPCILCKETKDADGKIISKEGFIYYHPAADKELNTNYYLDDGKIEYVDLNETDGKISLGIINDDMSRNVKAYTINEDPNIHLYTNRIQNARSKSEKISMPYKNSSWKALYDEYIKYNKLWNIEHFYIQEFKELYRGEEYKDISRDNKISVDENPHQIPEIIGLGDDNIVFSAFPHVKRYPYHNYYAYVNREIYELGQSIDTNVVPINKKIEFIVGCEYVSPDGSEVLQGETKIDNVVLDTTFPPYPKLIEDVESIMTEPFEVNVIREKSGDEYIQYESKLNGKDWNINNERVRERYIIEDGEYMLDMVARKKSNGTFRYRSSCFTVNTFQHVPLQPLKTKIIPLKITNTPTIGTEGELVLDANSGNYGFVRNGEIYSPTATLSTELLNIEENSNDMSKMYLSCRQHLDTLLERYSINSVNMGALFNGKNGAALRYSIITEECDRIKEEISNFNDSIIDTEVYLNNIDKKLDDIKEELDKFKEELLKDNESAFKIIRNLSLVGHSNLRKAMRSNAELKNKINETLLNKAFEEYKQSEMEKYYRFRNELYADRLKNGGENNE